MKTIKPTRYERGRRLEYHARSDLRKQGFTVIRSAGSKGPADLVAINQKQVLLVQVKSPGGVLDSDIQKLQSVSAPANVRLEIWEYVPGKPHTWRVTKLNSRRRRGE